MSGHTPGPWGLYCDDEAFLVQRTLDFSLVARSVSRSAEAEANARLIAAAPDLLEALKEALGDLLKDGYEHGAPPYEVDNDPVILKVRAAIAKAEGRS